MDHLFIRFYTFYIAVSHTRFSSCVFIGVFSELLFYSLSYIFTTSFRIWCNIKLVSKQVAHDYIYIYIVAVVLFQNITHDELHSFQAYESQFTSIYASTETCVAFRIVQSQEYARFETIEKKNWCEMKSHFQGSVKATPKSCNILLCMQYCTGLIIWLHLCGLILFCVITQKKQCTYKIK